MTDRPFALLNWARRRYGDTFRLPITSRQPPLYVFSASPDIAEIKRLSNQGDPAIVRAGAYNRILGSFPRDFVIRMQGEKHAWLRSRYTEIIRRAVREIEQAGIESLARRTLSDYAEQSIDARDLSDVLGMQIASWAVFGDPAIGRRMAQSLNRVRLLRPGSFQGPAFSPSHLSWRKLAIASETLRDYYRVYRGLNRDLSRVLADKQSPIAESGVSRNHLMHLTIVVYGGVASAIDHMLYYYLREQEARQAVIDATRNQEPEAEKVCAAFGDETRRLSPDTIGYMRTAKQDLRIGQWEVPEGEAILVSSCLAHRNAAIFERPHAFDLRRFLNRTYASHEYFPFGAGKYRCLGQSLAKKVTTGVLATVARHFDMTGSPHGGYRVSHAVGGLTRRSEPLRAQLKHRQPLA